MYAYVGHSTYFARLRAGHHYFFLVSKRNYLYIFIEKRIGFTTACALFEV